MKIVAFTMITNPVYRQDPWRESIRQMLLIVDEVIVVTGAPGDRRLFTEDFFTAGELKRINVGYLEWPQPEWGYDELPKHLNLGLQIARDSNAQWAIKFDIDTFIHEKDRTQLHKCLASFKAMDVIAATFEKYQFFKVDRAYEKGKVPLAINLDHNVWYGKDNTRYTDLCQPILKEGVGIELTTKIVMGTETRRYEIPYGAPISKHRVQPTGLHCYNYDYSFKTEPRARELLYHFDRSHAKFWGRGYSGKDLEEITMETAFDDYIKMVSGRIKKCSHLFKMEDHPAMIQQRVRDIRTSEFGSDLWGMIHIPDITVSFERK